MLEDLNQIHSPFIVSIAGNIGSGKTSLASLLSSSKGWPALLENAEGNPHLGPFYKEMHRWSFTSQIWFLAYRYKWYSDLQQQKSGVILLDRIIDEDALFAQILFRQGKMTPDEYSTYKMVFEQYRSMSIYPDLIIYLSASLETLKRHIQKRNRSSEIGIRDEYLAGLQAAYDAWASSFPSSKLLRIDMDKYDFIDSPADFAEIHMMIEIKVKELSFASRVSVELNFKAHSK